MSREVGRPSLLNEELLEKAKEYLHGGYKEIDNVVPSTAGLCCYLGVGKTAVYEWAKDTPENKLNALRVQFAETLEGIQLMQESMLISGGLSQQFSGTITKLMLANHGYSDKVQTDVTTNGESINKPSLDVSKLSDEQLRNLDTIIAQASESGTVEKKSN